MGTPGSVISYSMNPSIFVLSFYLYQQIYVDFFENDLYEHTACSIQHAGRQLWITDGWIFYFSL